MSYGMPLNTRAAMGGRAYSFEEAMLPPSALDQLDAAVNNPAYSPYGGSQASPVPTGATLFAQQQSWYGGAAAGAGPPPDMYSSPGSPLQPRPSAAHPSLGVYGGGPALRPMAPYGQYYPASSPGPPIQTTASNKGPDGANLFIFHIPNHFTNLDMYQLFCPYGNLLSVRIMVEKDTGRSRGFGFVSYDNPESAALAIKELNGFAVRPVFVCAPVCSSFPLPFWLTAICYCCCSLVRYRSATSASKFSTSRSGRRRCCTMVGRSDRGDPSTCTAMRTRLRPSRTLAPSTHPRRSRPLGPWHLRTFCGTARRRQEELPVPASGRTRRRCLPTARRLSTLGTETRPLSCRPPPQPRVREVEGWKVHRPRFWGRPATNRRRWRRWDPCKAPCLTLQGRANLRLRRDE